MITRCLSHCPKAPSLLRIFLAETMGTMILLLFGIGSVAQFKFMKGLNFLSVNFGWGLGCCFGVYWSIGVSGGHINPAVSLANVVTGRLSIRKLPVYWLAQMFGAFFASTICYGVYHDLLVVNGGDSFANAGIWSTYLAKGVSPITGFFDQVLGTAILVGTVFALTDERNNPPSLAVLPFIIGMLVTAIGICFGVNAGYGINPARDLAPRLFTYLAGFGDKTFTTDHYWSLIGIGGQMVGAVVGAVLYLISIELHHPPLKQEPHPPGMSYKVSTPELPRVDIKYETNESMYLSDTDSNFQNRLDNGSVVMAANHAIVVTYDDDVAGDSVSIF